MPAATATFIKDLNKLFGENVIISAEDMVIPRRFTSGSLALDVILGGGFPGNQWTEVIGLESSGKALAVDTPIITPSGWTTMEKLQPGDHVFDENGLPCTVTFATGVQLNRRCFEVTFRDGATIVADAEHRWTVLERQDGGRIKERTLTTQEMLDAGLKVKTGRQYRFHIPTALPLEYPDPSPVRLDAYTLGAWLGDGTSASGGFTSADEEIINVIRAAGFVVTKGAPSVARPYAWYIREIIPTLRSLGVLGDKHIPAEYQSASVADRVALLQGLMDTDGTSDLRGHCEFTTTSEHLADDVHELLVGLGVKVHRGEGDARLYGRWISRKYRLTFQSEFPVFRLTRKLERQQSARQSQFAMQRSVVAITPVESVPVKCIQVDSPRHLYLAGQDMIPTHNTARVFCSIAANQALDPEFTTLWVAAEHFDSEQALALGVDPSRVDLVRTQSMEVAFEAMIRATDSRLYDCIVLDSYPALSADDEAEKGMDEFTVGSGAKLMNKFTRKGGAASLRNADGSERPFYGIIINQWRDQIGGFSKFGVPKITPGGKGKNYFFYCRIEVSRVEYLKEKRPGIKDEVKVGQTIKYVTVKNKSAAPQQVASVDFYFRGAPFKGFKRGETDIAKEYVDVGVSLHVIAKRGGWYYFAGQQWQGEERVKQAVREDLDLRKKLATAVLELASDPQALAKMEEATDG